MVKILRVAVVVMVVCISRQASGATWYVNGLVSESGNGQSWETTFKTIQEGITAASGGETVLVAQGSYTENIQFNGKNIILRSTDPRDPDVVANTIINGNQAGSVVTFAGTEDESCVLAGFTIRNGKATYGGGILGGEMQCTHATIENNIITGNSADNGGGGLDYCNGAIRNNIIIGNSAENGGGVDWCEATIRNNIIAGNTAGWLGGGLYTCGGKIENNTIVGNTADYGGGLSDCNGSILNCIIWGNNASDDPQVGASNIPSYSCIQDWVGGGQGIIQENPRFLDPDGPDDDPNTYHDNNYRPSPNSPCVDAGNNEVWMSEAVDLDGIPRIIKGTSSLTVDMGAYEYMPPSIVDIRKEVLGSLHLTWTSRHGDTYTIWSSVDPSTPAWSNEASIPSQGEITRWTDTMPVGQRKFYRVEVR